MGKTLDNTYFINYTNSFKIDNKTFTFRKKVLFDVTDTPKTINQVDNNNCLGYWINRKFISLLKIKEIVTNNKITVDLSDLQWFRQIELDEVFNL